MVHVHGAQVQQLVAQTRGVPAEQLLAVAVDVGKTSAMALGCDFTGELLARRFQFALTQSGVAELVRRVQAVRAAQPVGLVRVGIEAAGHDHRPLTAAGVLPGGWQVVELNPAHVTAQRRTNGQRGVKTDAVDLAAIGDLLVAGRGQPVGRTDTVLVELAGLVAHRARRVLADDLALLADLDSQIGAVDQRLAALLPTTRFAILQSVPGWATVRVAAYAAAVGDLARWPSARQLYRAAGLTPTLYASAGRRRDGAISREGSVTLRRALLDLGVGLWHCDPPARADATSLRARGKPGGVIATALAHRANRIAYALVRDQAVYDPDRWR